MTESLNIARKWVNRLGMGFHPDTRGKDYRPRLSRAEIAEYEADMDFMFNAMHGQDPYEMGLTAMQELFPEAFETKESN